MNIKLPLISLMEKADRHLALFILVISSTLIIYNQLFLHRSIILELSITLLCVGCFYILVGNRIKGIPDLIILNISSTIIKKINILFFFLIIFANYLFWSNLYRPEIYFIIIVFCCALIAFDILYAQNYLYSYWVLFKIFLIAFILRAHVLYEYPGFYGMDPWEHMFWVRLLHEFGNISMVTGLNEGYPALFHIEALTTLLVTGLNLKDSLFFSIGFMYCIVIFFIFLFARNLAGLKIGLLSSLFIAINPFNISWGAWLIPTSIGILIYSAVLYLFSSKINQTAGNIIIILLTLLLIYVHTLSPVLIFITLVVYLIASYLSSKIFSFNSVSTFNNKFVFFLVAILGISLISRFVYNPYRIGRTFLEFILLPLIVTLKSSTEFQGGEIAGFTASDFPLNRIHFYILVAFTVIGVLYWLKPRIQSREKIGLIVTLIALIIFSFGPALFGIKNFIPGRWIAFLIVIAAPICASGIYQICNIPKTNFLKFSVLILIIAVFSFFTINSSDVNLHTPFYGELSENPDRYTFTESEMKAADTLLTVSDRKMDLGSDDYYMLAFRYYIMEKFGGVVAQNPNNYIVNEDSIMVRRAYFDRNRNIEGYESNLQSNLIYDNHEVWASLRKEK